MWVKIKGNVPVKAHQDDAGFDVCSLETKRLYGGATYVFKLGIFSEIEPGYEAQIRTRSSMSLKGLCVANSPGTIDAGYRGEWGVIIKNLNNFPISVGKGDKIAQVVFNKLPEVEIIPVDEITESDRGTGGFGSTGK